MTWTKRIATTLALTATFFAGSMAGVSPAAADVSPSNSYADYSLRGGGSLAPDGDYPNWWNWYNAYYWPKLAETVGTTFERSTTAVNRDHYVTVTYRIRTTQNTYVSVKFAAYWTPTSPFHGGGTYYDANISGAGPVSYP